MLAKFGSKFLQRSLLAYSTSDLPSLQSGHEGTQGAHLYWKTGGRIGVYW